MSSGSQHRPRNILYTHGQGVNADEIDAIGAKRYESQSGGEREIQRTMLELLNQMDGFDARGDVKVSFTCVWSLHTPLLLEFLTLQGTGLSACQILLNSAVRQQ